MFNKRITVIISIIIGLIVDIILRINTGEEGNLLVHSVVIIGASIISFALINIFIRLNR